MTRVVLDTNVLLSALINPHGAPGRILLAWADHAFDLVTALEQLEEFGGVARQPSLRAQIPAARVGRLINDMRELALFVKPLPAVDLSPDPADNFLLAIAQGGKADYLVSGDRRGVLSLKQHGNTQIVDARAFCALHP
jgi:uncharacterized protein